MRIALALLGLSGLALYLRTSTLSAVFQPGFVDFLENDSWYHARSIDHLVHNFPWRMPFDPYSGVGSTPQMATGPFYDYVIAFVAWMARASEYTTYAMAAWYPAVLAMLVVPAIFLLGKKTFGTRAGLIAAAIIATLPGHYLRISRAGYTDHHVMETLLATLFFWLLLRAVETPGRRSIVAGLCLGAYLLTFVGGAFLIAIVAAWMLCQQIRSRWLRKDQPPAVSTILTIFVVALAVVAPWYRTLWMGYTIAALVGGGAAVFLSDLWSRFAKSQVVFFGGLFTAAAIGVAAFALFPGIGSMITRLAPAAAGRSAGIAELQSLIFRNGAFTLWPVWNQFGGAIVLAAAGVIILAEMAVRRPDSRRDLLFVWTLVTMILAAGQVRMTYYFVIGLAVVAGYVADRLLESKAQIKWGIAAVLIAAVFAPNLSHAWEVGADDAMNPDWRDALAWLRKNTAEPFGNPDFYYARYKTPVPEAAYSVMAWWDYGYWIMTAGHRVPVTNPTQTNAQFSAAFLLAQNEEEAAQILEKWRARYVIVDSELPMQSADGVAAGKFPSLFNFDRELSPDDYMMLVEQRDANGTVSHRILYRPAYFRSMLVRLFVYGGLANEEPGGVALAFVRDDGKRRELVDLREFPTEESALAAEPGCRLEGCFLASASPYASCVRLEGLRRFRSVFSSATKVLKNDAGMIRNSVQVYEFR